MHSPLEILDFLTNVNMTHQKFPSNHVATYHGDLLLLLLLCDMKGQQPTPKCIKNKRKMNPLQGGGRGGGGGRSPSDTPHHHRQPPKPPNQGSTPPCQAWTTPKKPRNQNVQTTYIRCPFQFQCQTTYIFFSRLGRSKSKGMQEICFFF